VVLPIRRELAQLDALDLRYRTRATRPAADAAGESPPAPVASWVAWTTRHAKSADEAAAENEVTCRFAGFTWPLAGLRCRAGAAKAAPARSPRSLPLSHCNLSG
jgi:hypothetical protein